MKISFIGLPSGDGECFYWGQVSKEDMLTVLGKERYDLIVNWEIYFLLENGQPDLTFDQVQHALIPISDEVRRKAEEIANKLYPDDLLEVFNNNDNKKLKFTIEIEGIVE